jgi:hypothetical protein
MAFNNKIKRKKIIKCHNCKKPRHKKQTVFIRAEEKEASGQIHTRVKQKKPVTRIPFIVKLMVKSAGLDN